MHEKYTEVQLWSKYTLLYPITDINILTRYLKLNTVIFVSYEITIVFGFVTVLVQMDQKKETYGTVLQGWIH